MARSPESGGKEFLKPFRDDGIRAGASRARKTAVDLTASIRAPEADDVHDLHDALEAKNLLASAIDQCMQEKFNIPFLADDASEGTVSQDRRRLDNMRKVNMGPVLRKNFSNASSVLLRLDAVLSGNVSIKARQILKAIRKEGLIERANICARALRDALANQNGPGQRPSSTSSSEIDDSPGQKLVSSAQDAPDHDTTEAQEPALQPFNGRKEKRWLENLALGKKVLEKYPKWLEAINQAGFTAKEIEAYTAALGEENRPLNPLRGKDATWMLTKQEVRLLKKGERAIYTLRKFEKNVSEGKNKMSAAENAALNAALAADLVTAKEIEQYAALRAQLGAGRFAASKDGRALREKIATILKPVWKKELHERLKKHRDTTARIVREVPAKLRAGGNWLRRIPELRSKKEAEKSKLPGVQRSELTNYDQGVLDVLVHEHKVSAKDRDAYLSLWNRSENRGRPQTPEERVVFNRVNRYLFPKG